MSFNQQSFPCEVDHWDSLQESLQILETQMDSILSTCSSWPFFERELDKMIHRGSLQHQPSCDSENISSLFALWAFMKKKQEWFLNKGLHWCQWKVQKFLLGQEKKYGPVFQD